MKKKKSHAAPITKKAFFIVLVYVLLATIYSYVAVHNEMDIKVLDYLFFPAYYFPFIIMQAEREPMLKLVICQFITTLILWPVCWLGIIIFQSDKVAAAKH